MHRVILALLVLVTACTRPGPGDGSFRQVSAPIYSNAALDLDRMVGEWSQVASFAASGAPPCAPATVVVGRSGNGLSIAGALCNSGRRQAVSGALAPAGTGRFALQGADPHGLGQVWWVLWVDTGYRTLIVGTPSGDFGFVLNRGGALPADRANAAREILDFNGYKVVRLVTVPVRG